MSQLFKTISEQMLTPYERFAKSCVTDVNSRSELEHRGCCHRLKAQEGSYRWCEFGEKVQLKSNRATAQGMYVKQPAQQHCRILLLVYMLIISKNDNKRGVLSRGPIIALGKGIIELQNTYFSLRILCLSAVSGFTIM